MKIVMVVAMVRVVEEEELEEEEVENVAGYQFTCSSWLLVVMTMMS